MNNTIWGNPLQTACFTDESSPDTELSDLNNWEHVNFSPAISYDPASRTNTLSASMMPNAPEHIIYEFEVEPNTEYEFSCYVDSRDFNEIYGGGSGEHVWMAVCSDRISTDAGTYLVSQSYYVLGKERILPDSFGRHSVRFYTAIPERMSELIIPDPVDDETEENELDENENEENATEENATELTRVFLYFDFGAVEDESLVEMTISKVACTKVPGNNFWIQEPMEVNGHIYGSRSGDPFDLDIVAVSTGAWARSLTDSANNHHIFFLSGNEFKLLDVKTCESGFCASSEYHSTPKIINGRTYHALHESWSDIGPGTPGYVNIWETTYYPIEDFPSDDEIYLELSKLISSSAPEVHAYWWRVAEYSNKQLYEHLGVSDGAISKGEVDAMFADYLTFSTRVDNYYAAIYGTS